MKRSMLALVVLAVGLILVANGAAIACDKTSGKPCTQPCDKIKTAKAEGSSEAALTAVGHEGCPYLTGAKAAAAPDVKTEGTETVTLAVTKMTCGGCATHVTKTLAALDGVTDVSVSLEKGTAEVAYQPEKVKPEAMTAAVTKIGYPTTLVASTGKAANDGNAPHTCSAELAKKLGCDPSACAAAQKALSEKNKTENTSKAESEGNK